MYNIIKKESNMLKKLTLLFALTLVTNNIAMAAYDNQFVVKPTNTQVRQYGAPNYNNYGNYGSQSAYYPQQNYYGQQNYSQQPTYNNYSQNNYNQNNTLKGRVVTVPSGISIPAVTTSAIGSANSYVGQTVSLVLGSDFYYNNNLIAPAGSTVSGTICESGKAKHGSMNGKLNIRFTQITTPYGLQIPISAIIRTEDGTGIIKGGTKMDVTKNYAKDIAIGSAIGAIAGTAIAPMSGGKVGKGAVYGTAVGAGSGLVKSLWDKGYDVEIPANYSLELVLTQPITVNPSSYNYQY